MRWSFELFSHRIFELWRVRASDTSRTNSSSITTSSAFAATTIIITFALVLEYIVSSAGLLLCICLLCSSCTLVNDTAHLLLLLPWPKCFSLALKPLPILFACKSLNARARLCQDDLHQISYFFHPQHQRLWRVPHEGPSMGSRTERQEARRLWADPHRNEHEPTKC